MSWTWEFQCFATIFTAIIHIWNPHTRTQTHSQQPFFEVKGCVCERKFSWWRRTFIILHISLKIYFNKQNEVVLQLRALNMAREKRVRGEWNATYQLSWTSSFTLLFMAKRVFYMLNVENGMNIVKYNVQILDIWWLKRIKFNYYLTMLVWGLHTNRFSLMNEMSQAYKLRDRDRNWDKDRDKDRDI